VRWKKETLRSFEARVDIPGRGDRLLLSTPDAVCEMEIELRTHRREQMQPVRRVHGRATPDGWL
jgi:hypothetical protein